MSYTNFTDPKGLAKGCPFYFHKCTLNPVSTSLLIGLTSHGASGIEYEFCQAFEQYNKAHYLCLSSLNRNGYYIDGGLSNDYSSLSSVTQVIKDIISAYSITNLVLVGEGSAGTGAIFYGWDLAKNYTTSILAFAPYNNLPTANWNLNKDICSLDPSPGFKKNFKILADPDPKFNNETIRFAGLSTYFDIVDSEGGQHLAKSSYLRGDLFKLFDDEIAITDKIDVDYGQLTQKIWDTPRIVNHAEEVAQGYGQAGIVRNPLVPSKFSPTNGATGVSTKVTFSVMFPEDIYLGEGEIVFEDANKEHVVTVNVKDENVVSYDRDTINVDLTNHPLAANTQYTVTLNPRTVIALSDGTPLDGWIGEMGTYSFTTA